TFAEGRLERVLDAPDAGVGLEAVDDDLRRLLARSELLELDGAAPLPDTEEAARLEVGPGRLPALGARGEGDREARVLGESGQLARGACRVVGPHLAAAPRAPEDR